MKKDHSDISEFIDRVESADANCYSELFPEPNVKEQLSLLFTHEEASSSGVPLITVETNNATY